MKKHFKILLPLLLIVALVSCQQEKKPYVGTWADDNMTIILKDDNTFEIKDKDGAIKGTYKVNDDELSLVVEEVFEENPVNENIKVGDEIKVKFKVENDVFSVTYDGKVYDFLRRNKKGAVHCSNVRPFLICALCKSQYKNVIVSCLFIICFTCLSDM